MRILSLLIVILLAATTLASEKLTFDFESGSLQKEGWIIVSGSNTKPIGSRNTEFHNNTVPYKKRGQYYLTTLEQSANANPTDDVKCVLQSPVFTITGDWITFMVGGADNPQTYVGLFEVMKDFNFKEIYVARGKNSQGMDSIAWDVSKFKGRSFVIRVIDNAVGSWAHIKCDAFDIDGKIDTVQTIACQKNIEKIENEKQRLLEAKKVELKKELDAPILYIARKQYRPDHHNTATMFQKGEINFASFVGRSFIRVWEPKTNKIVTLLELPDGIVRDPTISSDGKRVLFSFRTSKDDYYHIGEMTIDLNRPAIVLNANDTPTNNPLLAKGRSAQGDFVFRQITFLEGISDIDPIYLPTGEIMFASTREPKYCMCNRHIMCNLYKMNSDGSNIIQVGKSTLFEGHLSLLSDGRVLYDRWEYVDRNFGDAQGIWVTNPDGARHEIFWGNNTAAPGGVIDAQILPESESVFLCTFSSCHDRPWGAIALVDRRLGIDGRASVLETWPKEAVNFMNNTPNPNGALKEARRYDAYSQLPLKFEDPFPWDNDLFLCSGMYGNGDVMGIYVLERFGDMTLIHTDPDGCFDPMPIRSSELQTAIQNRVDFSQSTGTFFIFNVNEGDAIKPGFISDTSSATDGNKKVDYSFGKNEVIPKAKYLRVVESPEKRFWTNTSWNGGNGTQGPGMAWNDFNNKRILGTVEVENDGSVFFEVPADRYVYFQLLDEKKQLIQSMRSGVIVRPGEANSCVGCHENRLEAPSSAYTTSKASKGQPKKLQPWFGPERLFSYVEEVQPVFDKYCLCCHDYGKKGAETVNLAGDLNMIFNTSYTQLRFKELVTVPGAGPHLKLPPRSWGSSKSRLTKIVSGTHPRPEIDQKRKELGVWFDQNTNPEAYERIITWIDINAPYYPVYGSAYQNNRFGRAPIDNDAIKRLEVLTGVKTIPIREGVVDNSGAIFGIDFAVSFTRPEKSPCLGKWKTEEDRQTPEYKEALAIINQGKINLEKQSRGEASNFQPVLENEVRQQKKYDTLREREKAMRQAILKGKKLYD